MHSRWSRRLTGFARGDLAEYNPYSGKRKVEKDQETVGNVEQNRETFEKAWMRIETDENGKIGDCKGRRMGRRRPGEERRCHTGNIEALEMSLTTLFLVSTRLRGGRITGLDGVELRA